VFLTNKSLFVIISLSLLLACSDDTAPIVKTKITQHSLPVVIIKQEKLPIFYRAIGTVVSDNRVDITSRVTGFIKEILVKEGQKVVRGQVLIQLDDSSIQDNIAELNTQLNLAKTTFERQQRLWDQKIGSEMQYLQAKTQFESLENNKTALVNQAAKMKIKAPFSGIIDEIFPKNGELVSSQLTVVRLVNLDQVYLEADVTETYLPYIKKGNEALINFPSIHTEMKSEIAQVGNIINPNNRSFKTKINLKNKNDLIKPNLLADIKIKDFAENGIVIPTSLIQKDKDGNSFIFLIHSNNADFKVSKKIIKVSKEYDQKSLITEGLEVNDTIVNKGSRIVKDGELVKIIN